MENLKPCPFCGGEAGVSIISMGGSGTEGNVHFKIQCKDCGATATSTTYVAMGKLGNGLEVKFAGTAMEKATEDWNRRERKKIEPMRDSVFSERLGILLRARGMTQRELAEKAGISSSLIGEYLHKKREPHAKTIIKLAKTLGVSPDYLLGLTSRPTQRI